MQQASVAVGAKCVQAGSTDTGESLLGFANQCGFCQYGAEAGCTETVQPDRVFTGNCSIPTIEPQRRESLCTSCLLVGVSMAVLSLTVPGLPQATSRRPGHNPDGPCGTSCQVLQMISVTLNLAELRNRSRNKTTLADQIKCRPSNRKQSPYRQDDNLLGFVP